MPIGTGLDMAQGGGAALHDSPRGVADMGGQQMGLLVMGIGVPEDLLQGDGAQRPHSGVGGIFARVLYDMG
jgi:hypothetical protein